MNGHALLALEYPRVKEMVEARLCSHAGRRAAESWGPSGDGPTVARLVEETAQMAAFLETEGNLDLTAAIVTDDILREARPEGACLAAREIMAVGRLCLLARLCRHALSAKDGTRPLLAGLAMGIPSLLGLEKRIGGVLDDEGHFRDTASPGLARVRQAKAAARQALADLYQALLARHGREGLFQEDIVVTRGGRYVLLVKSQYKGRMPGMVLDRTESGAAVYLEPQAAVPLNNGLMELEAEEKEEERRLLRLLTGHIREEAGAVSAASAVLGEIDLIQARALLGRRGRHVRPAFNAGGELVLMGARHPVLEELSPGKVVPLDLATGREHRVMVITGPNTGGKTVALKTVGLLCLMAQSGLFLPAGEGTELPVFREIWADIGDEQSLEQNLSTFSAHVRNIAEALVSAAGDTLVILDELGAGTDPWEGAPLAMAILEELIGRGALSIVSTHHGPLAVFASSTPGAVNASMDFDPATLEPTYRLVVGVPGRSNARQVARRMGLPENVVRRSLELQPRADQGVDTLVRDLMERRRALESELADLGLKRERLTAVLAEREAELDRQRQSREKVSREAREEAKRLLDRARGEMKDILSTAKDAGGRARHRLHRLGKEIDRALPPPPVRTTRPLSGEPREGQRVRLAGSSVEGTVAYVDGERKKVTLDLGGKTVDACWDRLEAAEERTPGARGRLRPESTSAPEMSTGRLDIRGLRGEEAVTAVNQFLDKAWLAGLPEAEILHGKGLGRLKDLCARLCGEHQGVGDCGPAPPERGGHGVTVVRFK